MKKTMQLAVGSCVIFGMAFLLGCSSNKVSYEDPNEVETLTAEFGSTDLNLVAESLARSLLQSPIIANSSDRKVITLAEVKNKTREYIDTRTITEKIRVQMLKSGRVQFAVSVNEMAGQSEELNRQNQSGMYRDESINKVGGMEAARYRIEGSVSSIVKQTSSVRNIYYLFSLSLIDNQTGLIEWADEKEIRKVEEK